MIAKEEVKAEEEAILKEVEELGRLTKEQEDVLYTIALRQDELGRQPTNMMECKLKENEAYQALIEREYLTYEVFSNAINPDQACVATSNSHCAYLPEARCLAVGFVVHGGCRGYLGIRLLRRGIWERTGSFPYVSIVYANGAQRASALIYKALGWQ